MEKLHEEKLLIFQHLQEIIKKKKDDSFKTHTETENSPSEKDQFPVRNTKLTSVSAIHSALLHSC